MSMIILCHFCQYYENALCRYLNVGVQVFLILSGYLYGTREIDDGVNFFVKRAKKILIPYYIFVILIIPCYVLFCPGKISLLLSLKVLLLSDQVPGLGHLWFVPYVLLCYFFTPILFQIRQKTEHLTPSKITSLFALFVIMIQVVSMAYDSFFDYAYINCFIFGYFFRAGVERYGASFKRRVSVFVIAAAVVMNLARVLKFLLKLTFDDAHRVEYDLFISYSHLFLGMAIFIILLSLLKKAKASPLSRFADRYSYCIYLVHLVFILSPFNCMKITEYIFMNWLVVLVLIVISGIILNKLTEAFLSLL